MRRHSIYERNKEKQKTHGSTDNKQKKLIKTQSEIEKELNIRSYSEYRIKDDDSMRDYEDEDVETKMIRLVILKRKGGNVKENLNLVKKKINKNELPSKLPKIKQALSILENIDIQRKIKNFFKKLKAKSISVHTKKITTLFFQRLAKYSRKMYLKMTFKMIISYFISYINYKDGLNKSKSNSILVSPKTSTKKIKRFKVHNSRNIKVELMTKKSGNQKRGGVDKLIQKIEKEKELERIKQQTNIGNMNIINEKLKKLDSLKKKEKEYLMKMKEKQKKIQDEINLFRKKTNISEEGLSQIKQNNNFSEKDSSFLSEKTAKELGGTSDFKQGSNKNKGILSEVISSNEMDSIVSTKTKIIQIKDGNKIMRMIFIVIRVKKVKSHLEPKMK